MLFPASRENQLVGCPRVRRGHSGPHRAGDVVDIGDGDEQLQSRPPLVVARACVVEAQDLRALPEQTGGVRDVEHRGDDLVVEASSQVQSRQEVSHVGSVGPWRPRVTGNTVPDISHG
ncbi:hypothetical protein BH708_15025 [Brachybacterium sp. P6-10-X1]|nr:hypothetical protein BH708_15025 [Brachybacterium sp. P6-10-X1]